MGIVEGSPRTEGTGLWIAAKITVSLSFILYKERFVLNGNVGRVWLTLSQKGSVLVFS